MEPFTGDNAEKRNLMERIRRYWPGIRRRRKEINGYRRKETERMEETRQQELLWVSCLPLTYLYKPPLLPLLFHLLSFPSTTIETNERKNQNEPKTRKELTEKTKMNTDIESGSSLTPPMMALGLGGEEETNPLVLAMANPKMTMKELVLSIAGIGKEGVAARIQLALSFGADLREKSDEYCHEMKKIVDKYRVWEEAGQTEEEWKKEAFMNGVIEAQIENYERTHRRKLNAEKVCEQAWGEDWKKELGAVWEGVEGERTYQAMAKIARFPKYDFEEVQDMIDDVMNFRKENKKRTNKGPRVTLNDQIGRAHV